MFIVPNSLEISCKIFSNLAWENPNTILLFYVPITAAKKEKEELKK